jgi:hypothetical protein
LKIYDPREIRKILKNMEYNEIIPPAHSEHNIVYFQKEVLVELKMDEEYFPLEIELICERVGIKRADFEERYKLAKKHKI